MYFVYAINPDFMIHLDSKDIDSLYYEQWFESDKLKTNNNRFAG